MSNLLYQIESDILSSFEHYYAELKSSIENSITLIYNVEREFTGIGAYVTFYYKNSEVLYNNTLKNARYNNIFIESEEFIHDVPVSIKFNEKGVLVYIELEMGMQKFQYPTKYKIIYKKTNTVFDNL